MNAARGSLASLDRRPWVAAAFVAAITLAVFTPTLRAGFVYDARLQILTDPFLHDPRNWLPVLTFATLSMDVLDFNRPVNLASLMLDAAVWGREPFGYHLTSVLLHAGNVVLTWALLRRLAPDIPMAAGVVAPLLFGVHPIVTEAVCEPTFREDLLVACFTLTGLVVALGHDPALRGLDLPRVAACSACALLAVASKESGVAAAAAVAVGGLVVPARDRGRFWPAATGGAALAALAFLAARFLLEPTPSRIFEIRPAYPGGSLSAAMLLEPRILALYAQLIVLPFNLCADYGLQSVAHLPLPAAIAVVAAVGAAAALAVRSDRRMAIAVVLVAAPLLTVANLIPIYKAAADRYVYLPAAGVALAAGLLLDARRTARHDHVDPALVVAAAAALLLATACMERQRVWANPLALWTDTAAKNPAAYTAAAGLAEALRETGRLAEAEQAARRAIALSGGDRGEAWATLALVLDGQGRGPEARETLDRALAVDPRLADPDARVAALAMERPCAEDLKRLLSRGKTGR